MAEQLHKDYYRKFDSRCEVLAKRIEGYPIKDKGFFQKVQQLRNKRIEQGFDEHGSMHQYAKPYMLGVVLKRCRICLRKYQETGNYINLLDALNYLMFEFYNECDKVEPLDEYDVLSVFYNITWNECEQDVYEFALTAFHIYNNFHEIEYLQVIALAILVELSKFDLIMEV